MGARLDDGCRRGETTTLKWSQVDFERKLVRLEPGTTKNDRGREFPIGSDPELEALLRERWAATEQFKRRGKILPWGFFQDDGEMMGDYRDSWAPACRGAWCTTCAGARSVN